LLNIINTCIKVGTFPDSWKTSLIIPIPKIKIPLEPKYLRPVNLLPTYEKIFEIVLHTQLVNFIESNNILCKNQSGFRKHYSCETALQLVINKWRKDANNNNVTIAAMLDFQRAFETIDRELLELM
jgi:hypothetical protein